MRPRYWIGTAPSIQLPARSGRIGWPMSIDRRAIVSPATPEEANSLGAEVCQPKMPTPTACVWRRIAVAARVSASLSSSS